MRTFAALLMAGIYIHIPFCSKACHYCNFHFSTSLHRKDEFLKALQWEISNLHFPFEHSVERSIQTIYFGGGTPSLLQQRELASVLENIHQHFAVADNVELTLEANPDDLTKEKINQLKSIGINRLSIGVQSFDDSDLKWMNRAHHAIQAETAIKTAQDAGITNLSIDLIYGLPNMSLAHWQQNIEKAIRLEVPHLSCYALTVEERTALDYFIKKGKIAPVSDGVQADHFLLLMDMLQTNNYEHYEISNFAMPGMRSQHNSSYWQGKPYYGFGPSAHSFDGVNIRWWNMANNTLYINQIAAPGHQYEFETLSPTQRINESIMTLLRTIEGLPVNAGSKTIAYMQVNQAQWRLFDEQVGSFKQRNWLEHKDSRLVLTKHGKLYADHIAASLFIEA